MTEFNLMQDLTDQIVKDFGFPSSSLTHVTNIAQRICGLHCCMGRLSNGKSNLSSKDATIYVDENCSPHEYVILVARAIGRWLLHEEFKTSEWQSRHSLLGRLRQVLGSTKAKDMHWLM
jgi:hypothetical protein